MDGIGAKGLKTKLIINYLPQKMTDNEFRVLFGQYGALESYRIMRDKATNYSFGYGFIDYQKAEDACTAIQKLNGHKIGSKTLRVAYSKPPGSSKNVNLYVSGLGPQTNEDKLREIFSVYGEIVNVKILYEQDGTTKGYGFVLFKEKPHADAAIRALQGYCDGYGMNLQIKYAKEPSEQQRTHRKFQEYLQSSYPQQHMVAYGGEYHGVLPINANPQVAYATADGVGSGYGGGYAAVEYGAIPVTQNNPKATRGRGGARFNPIARPIGGGAMAVGMQGGADSTNIIKIFVYNIGPNAQEKDLYGLFSKFGRITQVDVCYGKGYGFVHMPIPYEAYEAVKALNGAPYNGKSLQVSIKTPKDH